MTTSYGNQAAASTEAVAEQPAVLQLDGFITDVKPATTSTTPLFLSLDAHRAAGTCVYTLDAEQRRVYLPSKFIASIHEIKVVERDYGGDYEAYTKLAVSMTVGQRLYTLYVGLSSWAGQSLLTCLGQLTEAQLHTPLLLKAVAGRRTCFFRVAVDSGEGEWAAVSINENMLSNRMEASDLQLLATSVDELLASK